MVLQEDLLSGSVIYSRSQFYLPHLTPQSELKVRCSKAKPVLVYQRHFQKVRTSPIYFYLEAQSLLVSDKYCRGMQDYIKIAMLQTNPCCSSLASTKLSRSPHLNPDDQTNEQHHPNPETNQSRHLLPTFHRFLSYKTEIFAGRLYMCLQFKSVKAHSHISLFLNIHCSNWQGKTDIRAYFC